MKKQFIYFVKAVLLILLANPVMMHQARAQTFVHPGGLHTLADLDRMKAKVLAGAHPWIDGWNAMIADSRAQKTYVAHPYNNIGGSGNRQQGTNDARAAYYNTLRWYITGDTAYAACAVRICNAWANTVNVVPSGELFQLPINNFMQSAELLRIYPGWAPADFTKFKTMALTYFYPACHDFLGSCTAPFSWDGPALASVMGIGVLCDDTAKYNEAVNYFKTGIGAGSILNGITQVSGQVPEMGRDQAHAAIGPAVLGELCQTAWNQGLDLYSFANNRLLAGFEFYCKYNLNHAVPWIPYNDCKSNNWLYVTPDLRNRIRSEPNSYEMIYNHYAVLQGLSAPYTKAMADLARPEMGEMYGTLTFTLDAAASPYPAHPSPAAPTGLTATPGVSRVYLTWTAPDGDVSQGYNILRSTSGSGPYTNIATWNDNTNTRYTDLTAVNGTTYYYVVSAINQSGTSGNSVPASAVPIASSSTLPTGWARKDIASVATTGTAGYANPGNSTFIVGGSGADIGGTADSHNYVYTAVTGDFSITARIADVTWAATGHRVGIVIRESLNADSKMLILSLGDQYNTQARFGTRSSTAGNTTWQDGDKNTVVPDVWLRLQRTGNVFTASQSVDMTNWFTIGTSTVAIANTYYAGLAVCAGSTTPGVFTTVTFDNVTTIGGGSTLPSAPKNLTATALNNTQVKLSWTASTAVTGYNLKRAIASAGPYATVTTGVTDSAYIDSGLVASTTYYYTIKSANLAGISADSVKTSVQTMALTLPPAPTGFTVTAGNTYVTLKWNATVQAPTSYNVKRATVSGGPYTTIKSVGNSFYIDSTAMNGTTYFYAVSAVNTLGEGPNSTVLSALPQIGQYSYWPFDESSSGITNDIWNGRIAALNTGAAITAGKFNNGVHVDGTANGYSTLPVGVVSTLNDFSVSAWIRLDAVSSQIRVFDFGSGTSSYMFFTPRSTTGFPRFAITTGSNGAEQGINGTSAIPTGVWTHIVVTLSGNIGILYVNGAEVARNSAITLKPADLGGTTQNYIGKSQWPGDPLLNGIVDDFRIYSKALTPAQISNIYHLFNQTIVFNPIAYKTADDADFIPVVTASSGLPVSFTSSDTTVAIIVNNTIHIAGPGMSVITALQAGNESYAGTTLSQTLTVTGPPRVPAVTTAAGDAQVTLSWAPSSSAINYKVKRSLVNGGPYTIIANPTTAGYTDGTAVNGTTYYYVVSAVNTYGESSNSTEVSAKPFVSKYSYWPFDETSGAVALDVWNNRKITLSTAATWAAGKYNNGLNLNGTVNSYAAIPAGVVSSLNDFTVSAWIKLNAVSTQVRVFDFGSGTASYMFLTPKSNSGFPRFAITTGSNGAEQGINGTAAIPTGVWTHVVVTLSGNVGILYVNGAEVGRNNTITLKPSSLGSTTQNYIGKSQWPGDPVLNGTVDDFRIYSKALTAAEINAMENLLSQTITFNTITQKAVGDADFNPGATASSGLPVSFTSSDTTVAAILNGKIHIKGAGTTVITASQAGNATYLPASSVSQSLTVTKLAQIITFNVLPAKRPGDADFSISATASSGLPVSFGSSNANVATVTNGLVHIEGTGTTVITASQPGNATYKDTTLSQTFTVIPLNLQVQYQDGDTGQLTNNIARPYMKVVNADSVGVAYSELTMRYWFTAENYAGINTWIDYAQLGNSNVKMKYVPLDQPRNGALGYVEYSFTATGNLGANSNTGQIQSRFANQDWGLLNEADDYSYQSNTGSYGANNHITLYRNGMLIWGTEPAAATALTSLTVSYQNQNTGTSGNTISTYLSINNTGNVPVAYGDITARYWFIKDGTQSLNYWIDYAEKGISNIGGNFVPLGTTLTGADTYFELTVNAAAGVLYPLSTSGNIQYRIAKADWSNFNELNDYSYLPKDVMKENNHITVYYKGQLIYGTEPPVSGTMALTKTALAATAPSLAVNDGIVVHQGLSPNGDGINDFLVIDGLAAHPDNRLTILNRNGVKVFEARGYDNGSKIFDGHSSINGAMQQPGTYYYSLDYLAGKENIHKTGFIILKY